MLLQVATYEKEKEEGKAHAEKGLRAKKVVEEAQKEKVGADVVDKKEEEDHVEGEQEKDEDEVVDDASTLPKEEEKEEEGIDGGGRRSAPASSSAAPFLTLGSTVVLRQGSPPLSLPRMA